MPPEKKTVGLTAKKVAQPPVLLGCHRKKRGAGGKVLKVSKKSILKKKGGGKHGTTKRKNRGGKFCAAALEVEGVLDQKWKGEEPTIKGGNFSHFQRSGTLCRGQREKAESGERLEVGVRAGGSSMHSQAICDHQEIAQKQQRVGRGKAPMVEDWSCRKLPSQGVTNECKKEWTANVKG